MRQCLFPSNKQRITKLSSNSSKLCSGVGVGVRLRANHGYSCCQRMVRSDATSAPHPLSSNSSKVGSGVVVGYTCCQRMVRSDATPAPSECPVTRRVSRSQQPPGASASSTTCRSAPSSRTALSHMPASSTVSSKVSSKERKIRGRARRLAALRAPACLPEQQKKRKKGLKN
jgi:hypothetical protein